MMVIQDDDSYLSLLHKCVFFAAKSLTCIECKTHQNFAKQINIVYSFSLYLGLPIDLEPLLRMCLTYCTTHSDTIFIVGTYFHVYVCW